MSAVSAHIYQISGYAIAASWLVNVWEWFIRLDEEVSLIWSMPHTAYIKWLYLFGKYFALAMQTAVLLVQTVYLADHPMSLRDCRIYRALEMVGATLLMLCFDIVLLLRIFALYGWRMMSCVFATFTVVAEFMMTVVTMLFTIPETMYDSTCTMVQIPKLLLLFVGGTLVSQAILLWLACRKRQRASRVRESIAWVTIRDGMLVFVCVAVFLIIVFLLILQNNPLTTLMIFFLPMFISVATSRLILNLQSVPYPEPTERLSTEIWGLSDNPDSLLLSGVLSQSPPLSR